MSACGRCETPLEDGDLRCFICALPAPIPVASGSGPVRAQVLRCTDCNAAIAYSAEARAPRCAFCGATMKVEQPVDPIETARVRIPFSVTREQAADSLRGWLGQRGWFAPKTLRDEAVLETLTPLCWAGWLVDADAAVAWTADSDEDARRSAWAPHSGQVTMKFDNIVVPATRGLDLEECRLLIPYYDLAKVIPVDAAKESDDVIVESFDAQRSAARKLVQEAIERTAKTRVEPHIPGRRFRNIHVACLLEQQRTERIALPAWVLAYRYRGNPYRAIVHGQRPEVVFGSSPKDWAKITAVIIAVIAVIAAIALLAFYLSAS